MRVKLVLTLVCVSVLFTSLASGRVKTRWTVVSGPGLDSRIQRQLHELAAESGVRLRFSGTAGSESKACRARDARGLLIELDLAADVGAFVAELTQEARGREVPLTAQLAKEGYILRCSYPQGKASDGAEPDSIRIRAASATGFHNALLRIPDLLAMTPAKFSTDFIPKPQSVRLHDDGAEVVVADYPSFPVRGVVEGFYGPPWSHADRLDVLRFEGQHGMNVYIYAPKDDPYHRKLWREPYPPEQLRQMSELAHVARENFVDLSFAISPGLSMVYSSDADFQALAHKLETLGKVGVSNFALFLDDVPEDLVRAEDKARFKTLAQAHVELINRLYDHLRSLSPDNRLAVCPTTYTNEWGSRDYIEELGAGVNPAVPLDWTGTEVIPGTITVAQAEEWGKLLRRKPLVWDNYPTNDGDPWWLNLDPLRGRDTGLFVATEGLLSNPMDQAYASLIPLQTIADYLWNPPTYDAAKSQHHALVSQYGPDGADLLAPLLRFFAADGGGHSIFQQLFEETWSPIDAPAIESRISRLRSLIAPLQGRHGFEKLVPELSPLPDIVRDRLDRVRADAAFQHLPNGQLQWDRERDVLQASRISSALVFDGDFSKWESGPVYRMNQKSQIVHGEDLWKEPSQFSARVALAWDENNLYFGVDVIDPDLYQPFSGREVENGDAFRLVLNTTTPIAIRSDRTAQVFDLYLSPGNFAGVNPSVYCNEDFFPPRSLPHDYSREIHATWKRTPAGFSGDIVVSASFFSGQTFAPGQEVGLSFEAQKVFPPKDPLEDLPDRIVFSSKPAGLFPAEPEDPVTLQRMKLLLARGAPEDGQHVH